MEGFRGKTRGQSWAVRHFGPRSGGLLAGMIAMPRMRSTMLCDFALAALLLCACTAQIYSPGPPVTRPTETPDMFVMPDGMRLPYRAWLPNGPPKAVVLALHGMNDSRDAWEIPAPDFAAAGIAIYAPDQR